MNNDDQQLAALLNTLPTPEHRQGFWEDLNTQLATQTDPSTTGLSAISDFEPPEGPDESDNGTNEHRRAWWGVVALAAAAIVLAAVFGVRALTDDDPPVVTEIITPTTVPVPVDKEADAPAVVDISDSVEAVDLGGHTAIGMAVGAGSIWMTAEDRELLRIDPATGAIDAVIDMPADLTGALAVSDDAVWVMGGESLHRVDPATNSIVETIGGVGYGHVAARDDSVWVSGAASSGVEVRRIDPATNTITATIPIGSLNPRSLLDGEGLAIGPDGDVYVDADGIIHRIDPLRNTAVDLVETRFPKQGLLVDDAVWMVGDYNVIRSDAALENSVGVFWPEVGTPSGAGFVDGDVLVLGSGRRLYRLDETSGAHTNTFDLGVDFSVGSDDAAYSNTYMGLFSDQPYLAQYEDFLWIFGGAKLWRVELDAINDTPPTTDTEPSAQPDETAATFPETVDLSDAMDEFASDIGISGVESGPGGMWALSQSQQEVVRIDPDSGAVMARIAVFDSPDQFIPTYGTGLVTGPDAVWVPATDGILYRIDPTSEVITAQIALGESDVGEWSTGGEASNDAVWLSNSDVAAMNKIDPDTNTATAEVSAGSPTRFAKVGVAIGDEAVWVGGHQRVDRIDPSTNEVTASIEMPQGSGRVEVVADGNDVWAIGDSVAVLIDGSTNEIAETIILPGPVSDAVLSDGMLTIGSGQQTLYRLDTSTRVLDAVIDLRPEGPRTEHLAIRDDYLWISMDISPDRNPFPLTRIALEDIYAAS